MPIGKNRPFYGKKRHGVGKRTLWRGLQKRERNQAIETLITDEKKQLHWEPVREKKKHLRLEKKKPRHPLAKPPVGPGH